jgi:hypothetical protein
MAVLSCCPRSPLKFLMSDGTKPEQLICHAGLLIDRRIFEAKDIFEVVSTEASGR